MPATSPIAELFDNLSRAVKRDDRVMVESVPKGPGHHIHRIVGLTPADVQREIDRLAAQVEAAPADGLCSFTGPARLRSGPDAGLYAAEGSTRIFAPAIVEVA